MCKVDPKALEALAIRVNGAGSLLTAIEMALIPATRETITTVILSLRDVADRLERKMREDAHADPH
jgi:hypothetical protein